MIYYLRGGLLNEKNDNGNVRYSNRFSWRMFSKR